MVRIRLKRMGRRHRPFYRIVVVDRREERNGRTIEDIGTYDAMIEEEDKKVSLKTERAMYWLGVGAQPSETVATLLRKSGLQLPKKKTRKKKKTGTAARDSK